MKKPASILMAAFLASVSVGAMAAALSNANFGWLGWIEPPPQRALARFFVLLQWISRQSSPRLQAGAVLDHQNRCNAQRKYPSIFITVGAHIRLWSP